MILRVINTLVAEFTKEDWITRLNAFKKERGRQYDSP